MKNETLRWKVQELGASGRWIMGRVWGSRAEAQADAEGRQGRARIRTVRGAK